MRLTPLTAADVPHPSLYAPDPATLHAPWICAPQLLNVDGKYNARAFGRGGYSWGRIDSRRSEWN